MNELNSNSNIVKTNFFSIIKKNNYSLVYLSNINHQQSLSVLQDKLHSCCTTPTHLLFNFASISEITDEWFNFFTSLEQQLSTSKKKLILFYVPTNLVTKLSKKEQNTTEDKNTGFNVVPNLIMALEELDVFLGKIDSINFVQIFVNALIKIYYLEYQTIVKKDKIFIKKENLNTLEGDFTGAFNVDSNTNQYLMFLSFPKETITNLINSKDKISDINSLSSPPASPAPTILPSMADSIVLVKEQIKKIHSQVMLILAGLESNVTLSDVSILEGREFKKIEAIKLTDSLEKGYSIILPFSCEFGKLYISLWFKELNSAINFME
ncbi:MAG: hypothetical protein HQK51_02275 [Oligoflexia bacterium]|nr:hypothetical protein [Oligoflexia bacterium]